MSSSRPSRRAHIREQLNNVGLRATPQRLIVLEAMLSHERRHLRADDVYDKIAEGSSRVGMATIYRVLGHLTEVGILARHLFSSDSGAAVYEVQHGSPHDHLICVQCGKVDEFTDEAVASLSRERAAQQGFTLSQHHLALYGYCAGCSAHDLGGRASRKKATGGAVG